MSSGAGSSPRILPGIPELGRRVRKFVGLDFCGRKWDMLQRGVNELAAELGRGAPETLLAELLRAVPGDGIFDRLVTRLTIGETYFLRDKPVFAALREYILPELGRAARKERKLNIWCMGASSGEEPYSIAMLIDERPDLFAGWRIAIAGCDINPEVLVKARAGIYSEWSLRATPDNVRRRYFRALGRGLYQFDERLRRMVNFYHLNLAENNFVVPGCEGRPADLICCRNVLIYFSPEVQARVLERLSRQLRRGGWLLVAPSEVSVVSEPELELVHFPRAIAFRRRTTFRVACSRQHSQTRSRYCSASFGTRRSAAGRPPVQRPHLVAVVRSGELRPGGRPELSEVCSEGAGEGLGQHLEELLEQHDYHGVLELLAGYEAQTLTALPDYARVTACRARALASLGKLEAARVAAAQALEVDRVDPYCYYLAATIAGELGNYIEAAAFSRRALFLDPGFIMAHFSRAMFLKRLGHSGSRRHLQRVLKLLGEMDDDCRIRYGEGLVAGRLREIVLSLLEES